jgi:dynein heavy chain
MSEAVGVELIVNEESTLAMMIEYGLPKVVKKLEEISAVASKEYSLEKALVAMKSTWASVKFELIPYRYFWLHKSDYKSRPQFVS